MSMISAGVLNEVSKAMKLPTGFEQKTFIEHAKYAIAKAGVQTALNVSFKKQSLSDALKVGIVDIITTTCANTMLNELSVQHKQGQLDLISHKLFNTILGGVEGAIINGEKGAIAGMLAAYSTETLLQLFGNEKVVADAINEHSADATNTPNKQQLLKQADKVRVISSIISLLANTDIATANKVTERHLTEGFLILPEPQDRDSIANLDIGQQNAPTQQELLVNGEAANQSMSAGGQEGGLAEHADNQNNNDSLKIAIPISEKDDLIDLVRKYKNDDESWVGAYGRFLRESGLKESLDQTLELLGEWTEKSIKVALSLPERAIRGFAINLGIDVDNNTNYSEKKIDDLKTAIANKVHKDSQPIIPVLRAIVKKYNITADELLFVETALEIAQFAKASKSLARGVGNSVERVLRKVDNSQIGKSLFFSNDASVLKYEVKTKSIKPTTADKAQKFRTGKKIEKISCSNGLVYEGAPYHSNMPNNLKSKAPANPKYALENSVQVKPSSSQRISYDPTTKEIVVLMEHSPSVFHGHVRTWAQLTEHQKKALKDELGFSYRGKPPKL